MDAQTRRLRARSKVVAGKRGELPQAEARGLGRRNKRHDTFPLKTCDHVEGGTMFYFRKRKEIRPGMFEMVNGGFLKGGTKCPNSAIVGSRCLQHLTKAS